MLKTSKNIYAGIFFKLKFIPDNQITMQLL